jgi:hypothetical protein
MSRWLAWPLSPSSLGPLRNEDVFDLYGRVQVGAKVMVI